jgi:hypothetical protein
MSRGRPTKFGAYLRASRLGFHWSEAHNRFIRMSACGSGLWLVEICTQDGLFDSRLPRRDKHIVWWEGDAQGLLSASPVLVALASDPGLEPGELYTLILNDAGERA